MRTDSSNRVMASVLFRVSRFVFVIIVVVNGELLFLLEELGFRLWDKVIHSFTNLSKISVPELIIWLDDSEEGVAVEKDVLFICVKRPG